MAYVPPEYGEVGSQLNVEIRNQSVGAKIVPTPFYKRPKINVSPKSSN
ncbi:MAG: glycine cleavage T C-terminal barrel domain-containing protein [Terriglobales bacterium]